VIETDVPGIKGFAEIAVVLLKLDDGARRRMQQQDAVPPVAEDPVDFGHVKQSSPPPCACLGVADRKRNV
jgi:hypothetical protein